MDDLKHYPGMPEEYINRKLTERVNAIENAVGVSVIAPKADGTDQTVQIQ